VPHTRTITDEAYAQTIPAKGEFYRMSGHPAYTSLAPVLRKFGTNSTTTPAEREPQDTYGPQGSEWWRHLQDYHRLLPRTLDTRSKDGTQGGTTSATAEAALKQERFFGTVDEFFFNSEREANGELSGGLRFTQDDVRKSRFFLTTHSRAPELNPFNRPKISLWPVQQSTGQRNEVDDALVRAGTLASHIYFFQRASEWTSATSPGSSQRQDDDAKLPRNDALLGYLLELSEKNIPGFGGSFFEKLGEQSRDQLLTAMFDKVRWGVNPATPFDQTIKAPLDEYRYLGPSNPASTDGYENSWGAVPSRIEDIGEELPIALVDELKKHGFDGPTRLAKGFGRFPTITEVAVVFAATKANPPVDGVTPTAPGFHDETTEIAAFIVVEPFVVAAGVPSLSPAYEYRIRHLDQFKIEELEDADSLKLPASVSSRVTYPPNGGLKWSGGNSPYVGFSGQFLTASGAPRALGVADSDNQFAFVSSGSCKLEATKGKAGQKLKFSGGTLQIEIHDLRDPAEKSLVQVMDVEFPAADIPVPLLALSNSAANGEPLADQLTIRFTPAPGEGDSAARLNHLFYRGDVIRSMSLQTPLSHGDARIASGRVYLNKDWFGKSHFYDPPIPPPPGFGTNPDDGFYGHSLRDGNYPASMQLGIWSGDAEMPAFDQPIPPLNRVTGYLAEGNNGRQGKVLEHLPAPGPAVPPNTIALNGDNGPADFDNGPGIIEDGPLVGVPDFNNAFNQSTALPNTGSTTSSWFDRGGLFADDNGVTYMPWRQASSAFIFGSLPTGVYGHADNPAPRPWQTLLLCPNPRARRTAPNSSEGPDWKASIVDIQRDHFGFKSPRDHLWLEFFHLPAIAPDGFGDAVSTEGKVNMNYQMMPFTWIKRATAMHGALHGVRLTAIPSSAVGINSGDEHYKKPDGTASGLQFRYAVDADKSLLAFDQQRFDAGDVFRSPSEICDMWLVPKRLEAHDYELGNVKPANPDVLSSYASMLDWWEGPDKADPTDGFEATGDNLREAPYAQLYPRLCTKSNVFTVHYRVQLLKKSRSTKPGEWDETRDTVAAEHRGQTTLERYLDLNKKTIPEKTIPDFANPDKFDPDKALDDYYNIRVVNRRDFKP